MILRLSWQSYCLCSVWRGSRAVGILAEYPEKSRNISNVRIFRDFQHKTLGISDVSTQQKTEYAKVAREIHKRQVVDSDRVLAACNT